LPAQSANTFSMMARTFFHERPPYPTPIRGIAMLVIFSASAWFLIAARAISIVQRAAGLSFLQVAQAAAQLAFLMAYFTARQ
jgi:hypothetical protein